MMHDVFMFGNVCGRPDAAVAALLRLRGWLTCSQTAPMHRRLIAPGIPMRSSPRERCDDRLKAHPPRIE